MPTRTQLDPTKHYPVDAHGLSMDALIAENESLRRQNAHLRTENAHLRAENARLQEGAKCRK